MATAGIPTATPMPSDRPRLLVVANTGGDGVYLRREPTRDRSRENLLKLWPDGTVLVPTGEVTRNDDWDWYSVRDPGGNVGWVPKQFVRD
jgi:hypothetical protein